MQATVQLSLDLTSTEEAVATAEIALRAGVDWLEAGTPLILAEGAHAVRALRHRFPGVPIVADLKIMDGAYSETELMAKAGASMVVIMGQAHDESIELAVKAGHDFGVKIMGDTMAMPDVVEGARRLEDLGCDFIVHHIGFDYRTLRRRRGLTPPLRSINSAPSSMPFESRSRPSGDSPLNKPSKLPATVPLWWSSALHSRWARTRPKPLPENSKSYCGSSPKKSMPMAMSVSSAQSE